MKSKLTLVFSWLGILVSFISGEAHAQPYSIDWYKVSRDGGTSINGEYAISGTVGQHDAGVTTSTGTNYLTLPSPAVNLFFRLNQ